MSIKHPLLLDYKGLDGTEHYIDPRQILESLDYAISQLDYSNYDTDKLRRAQQMVRYWCKKEGIKIGPTREALKKKQEAKEKRLDKHRNILHAAAIGNLALNDPLVKRALKRLEKK